MYLVKNKAMDRIGSFACVYSDNGMSLIPLLNEQLYTASDYFLFFGPIF